MQRILLFIMMLMVAVSVQSQSLSLEGTVVDQNGTPLPNANITVHGTDRGTTTNQRGSFQLSNLPEGPVRLTISYMGFNTETTRVTLPVDKPIRIVLTPTTLTGDEIIVTSLKYEQTLKNVPIPINVVKQERIDQIMPRDIPEAVNAEPGLAITRDGIWGSHINIRGLGRNNVVMMVDGNRIDTANDLAAGLSMIDVNDVERVEVIKGAASSLYGTGAVGGVVNILTKDGWYNDRFYARGSVSGGYSSVNQSSLGFAQVNAGHKHWYAKITTMTRDASNARTPNGTLMNSQYSDNNISARVGIKPFENHELKVNWQQYRGEDIGIPGGNPLFPSQADVRYPREHRDLMSVNYNWKNVTSSLAKLSVNYFKQDILRDVENVPHIVKTMPGTPTKKVNVLNILPRATHKTDGFQVQSDWIVSGHHFIAGVDAWQKDMDSFRTRNLRIDVLGPDGSVMNQIHQTIAERPIPLASYGSMGVYAQDEFSVSTKLQLTIGGRYDWIRVENDAAFQPMYMIVDGETNMSPPNQVKLWDAQTAGDQSWSANLGLLYKPSSSTDVTFTLARSFRSPYLEERYQYIDLGSLVKFGDPNLNPERGMFGDVGVRFWHDSWNLVANVFYNRINDMVIEAPATYEGREALQKTNIGSAELYGFDMRLEYNPWRSFTVYGSAAYVYGQDTYINDPLPLVPPLNGRLGISGPVSRFFRFELAATLFATQSRTADWEIETPGYTLLDAYLSSKSVSLGSLNGKLFLGIENILDRAYRNHLSTNRGAITAEPGRNVSVRLQLGI